MTNETSQTSSNPLFDPLVKKLSTPSIDQSIFFDGSNNPVAAAILKLNTPIEALVHLFIPFDPSTGTYVNCTLYNPSTGKDEAQRTMTIIKHSADITAAGQTALWTPSAGKRVRVMGFSIVVDPRPLRRWVCHHPTGRFHRPG